MNLSNHYAKYYPKANGIVDKEIRIRFALPTDALDISKIEVNIYGQYPDPYDVVIKKINRSLKKTESDNSLTKVWVALKKEKIIGFSKLDYKNNIINDFPDLIEGWYLTGITVHPHWRRIGVATLLVKSRLNWLKDKTNEVFYWSNKNNKASEALHKKFGFKKIKSSINTPMGYSAETWFKRGSSNLFKTIIN